MNFLKESVMTNSIIVFDTETTGLPKASPAPLSQQPFIIEFAGVKVTDDKEMEVIEEIEFKCRPPNPLPEIITKITGLTDDDLKDCKTFPEYYETLIDFYWGVKTMLAHNIAFDRNLVEFELMRINKVLQFPWPIHHVCTIEQTMKIRGYKLNLKKLYHYLFEEELEQRHRAMDDVIQLLKVSRELRKRGML